MQFLDLLNEVLMVKVDVGALRYPGQSMSDYALDFGFCNSA